MLPGIVHIPFVYTSKFNTLISSPTLPSEDYPFLNMLMLFFTSLAGRVRLSLLSNMRIFSPSSTAPANPVGHNQKRWSEDKAWALEMGSLRLAAQRPLPVTGRDNHFIREDMNFSVSWCLERKVEQCLLHTLSNGRREWVERGSDFFFLSGLLSCNLMSDFCCLPHLSQTLSALLWWCLLLVTVLHSPSIKVPLL